MKNIYAAFVFFTRLPFWRLKLYKLTSDDFDRVINYWAVTGLLTGGTMASVLWLSAQVLPYTAAIIIALTCRILMTGALHEDGLADFFDGFGGGSTREKTLEIMKDSHIGTYGVVSLILYFGLFFTLIANIPFSNACLLIFVADPLCKLTGSFITSLLPYVRNSETSKSKIVYKNMTTGSLILSLMAGILPFVVLVEPQFYPVALFPVIVFLSLVFLMKRKIQGYTGDCCGALFLLCELSFYLGINIFISLPWLLFP